MTAVSIPGIFTSIPKPAFPLVLAGVSKRLTGRPMILNSAGSLSLTSLGTGWAAASLLSLCGVSDEDVMKEYLLTNEELLPRLQSVLDKFKAGKGGALTTTISNMYVMEGEMQKVDPSVSLGTSF